MLKYKLRWSTLSDTSILVGSGNVTGEPLTRTENKNGQPSKMLRATMAPYSNLTCAGGLSGGMQIWVIVRAAATALGQI